MEKETRQTKESPYQCYCHLQLFNTYPNSGYDKSAQQRTQLSTVSVFLKKSKPYTPKVTKTKTHCNQVPYNLNKFQPYLI